MIVLCSILKVIERHSLSCPNVESERARKTPILALAFRAVSNVVDASWRFPMPRPFGSRSLMTVGSSVDRIITSRTGCIQNCGQHADHNGDKDNGDNGDKDNGDTNMKRITNESTPPPRRCFKAKIMHGNFAKFKGTRNLNKNY